MVRLLKREDEPAALALLGREHALNLILINDIVEYGMDNRGHIFHGDYYGFFKEEGGGVEEREARLRGIAALFNFGSLFLYAAGDEAATALARHVAGLEKHPRYFFSLAGHAAMFIEEMEKKGLTPSKMEAQECLVLRREGFRPQAGDAARARFAGPEDLAAVMRMHGAFQVEYYRSTSDLDEEFGQLAIERMAGEGITVAEVDGQPVAKVETMVRTSRMAQIGGVYTCPEHRGRGLAGACMSLLCGRLLRDYEACVLNVAAGNEPARRLYYGLGFEYVCDTRMAVFL